MSSQYIAACKLHKCKLDDSISEGKRLGVPQKYFEAAHHCIYEIGVKLGHVLWRKLFPDERVQADENFLDLTYDLIDNQKYELAVRLLDFACNDFKKFSDESKQLVLVVNRAQAYKWKGDEERCEKIMQAIDWSAKADQFRLADAVLADDWPRAAMFMKRIGPNGPIDQTAYRDWPLFRKLRKQEVFSATYEEVFSEAFAIKSEVKKKDLSPSSQEQIIEEAKLEADDTAF